LWACPAAYDWFCDHAHQYGYAKEDITLHHSRLTEPDKKRIEGKLIAALGADAWKNGEAGGIAILTQIGEMSLNISAPFMISEFCPYDRLAQRAGRLSRFEGMHPGPLYIVTPIKKGSYTPHHMDHRIAKRGNGDQHEHWWKCKI